MPELVLDEQQLTAIGSTLEQTQAQFPDQSLDRLRACLTMVASGKTPLSEHANQRPEFFYPGLNNRPWYDPSEIPACRILEDAYPAIRAELDSVLGYRKGFETFAGTIGERESYITGDMNVFYLRDAFSTQPERIATNRNLCPQTAKAIDNLPRMGETAFFSALNPGTYLAPHCGAENLRVTVHLGLKIPKDCAIEVGGIAKTWQEGKCIVFDDSFTHCAWNRSNTTRFIVLLDVWNPDLNDAEVQFFRTVGPMLNRTPVLAGADSLDGKTWWK